MSILFIIVQLFTTFFVIGIFTFGGGYAMLPLIQSQVVIYHNWISQSTFADIVAISQITPGPIGINSATYIGYQALINAGASAPVATIGSFVATLAVMLPSFFVILLIVKFYNKAKDGYVFNGVMGFLRPCVIGLIGSAALMLIVNVTWVGMPLFSKFQVALVKENIIDWKSWVFLIIALIASLKFKLNPILIIILGGIGGILLY